MLLACKFGYCVELHCINESINHSGRISVVEADFHFLTQSLYSVENRIGKIAAKELNSFFKLTWDNVMGKAHTLGGEKIQEAYC